MTGQAICFAVTLLFMDNISTTQKNVLCNNADYLVKESVAKGIDPYVFTALIYHESAFRPSVVSRAGACGLTQVMPRWSKYTCTELKKPRVSIREGASHLRRWLRRAEGDVVLALCGYNAGTRCFTNEKFKARVIKKYSHRVLRTSEMLRDQGESSDNSN